MNFIRYLIYARPLDSVLDTIRTELERANLPPLGLIRYPNSIDPTSGESLDDIPIKMFYTEWQDNSDVLNQVAFILRNIPGVVCLRGVAEGIEDHADAIVDPLANPQITELVASNTAFVIADRQLGTFVHGRRTEADVRSRSGDIRGRGSFTPPIFSGHGVLKASQGNLRGRCAFTPPVFSGHGVLTASHGNLIGSAKYFIIIPNLHL